MTNRKKLFKIKDFRKDMFVRRVFILEITVRQAGEMIGCNASVISRIENGKCPDVETFMKCCSWLKKSPAKYHQIVNKSGVKPKNKQKK